MTTQYSCIICGSDMGELPGDQFQICVSCDVRAMKAKKTNEEYYGEAIRDHFNAMQYVVVVDVHELLSFDDSIEAVCGALNQLALDSNEPYNRALQFRPLSEVLAC